MNYRALLPIAIPAGVLAACALITLAVITHASRLLQDDLRHAAAAQDHVLAVAAGEVSSPAARDARDRIEQAARRCLEPLGGVSRGMLGPPGAAHLASLCRRELELLVSLGGLQPAGSAVAAPSARPAPAAVLPSAPHDAVVAEAGVLLSVARAFDDVLDGALRLALTMLRIMLLAFFSLIALTAAFAVRRVKVMMDHVSEASSALRESEARNRRLAHVDEVTQLPNRTRFGEYLGELIEASAAGREKFALLFIDLDGFKAVNDTLSHAAGDELLRLVSLRLCELLRDSDMVARLGGDEFVVVANGVASAEQTSAVAKRIVAVIGQPYEVSGVECHVSASVGVTVYPEHGADAQTLLRNADLAMYEAKRLGKNGYVHYSARAEGRVRERVSIETALRRALPRGELSLAFQPVVSLATMRARSVEALCRWHHPVLGEVAPAKFIPVAEESGLIVEIGEWVLEEACRQLAAWRAGGAGEVQVAVNVTHQQIVSEGFHATVRRVLAQNALPGNALILEITEGALMEQRDHTLGRLQQLADLGVELALDDFGTGYSSLSHLHTLPIHAVKIDRSFLGSDEDQHRAIILTILGLARILQLNVVAEGVEQENAGIFLADAGCTYAQGYYFARPMPASAVDWQTDYRFLFHPESDLRRLLRA